MHASPVSMLGLLHESALQWPDYLVLGGYMLVLIGIGIALKKKAGTNLETYFLGGRKIPGWLNACSYAATCMNADVAPGYCGMTVITGLFVCWWYIALINGSDRKEAQIQQNDSRPSKGTVLVLNAPT